MPRCCRVWGHRLPLRKLGKLPTSMVVYQDTMSNRLALNRRTSSLILKATKHKYIYLPNTSPRNGPILRAPSLGSRRRFTVTMILGRIGNKSATHVFNMLGFSQLLIGLLAILWVVYVYGF